MSRGCQRLGLGWAVVLVLFFTSTARLGAQAEPDGLAFERQVSVQLATLDERLELGTFPDGSGSWTARLAAALERRGEISLAEELRGLGILRALEGSVDDPRRETPDSERLARLEALSESLRILWQAIEAGADIGGTADLAARTHLAERDDDPAAGRLSGVVLDRATDDGIAAFVSVLTEDGAFVSSVATAGNGRYTIAGLPAGSYRLLVETHRHGAALYGGVPCPAVATCDRMAGIEVVVAAGSETAGLDVRLEAQGSITGTVTAAASSAPLERVWVEILGENGVQVGSTYSLADGSYEAGSLPAGAYHLRTGTQRTYQNELYDDLPCPWRTCDPTAGTAVTVASGETTSGIDFALELLGSISGVVFESDSRFPVWAGTVIAYDDQGEEVRISSLTSLGTFHLPDLPAGTYTVEVRSFLGHQSQLWDTVACQPGCVPADGTPIIVSLAEDITGIDFPLARLGKITGTVTFALDDLQTGPERNQIRVYHSDGRFSVVRNVQLDGSYSLDGLQPGEYYVTTSTRAFRDEVYPGAPCTGGCDLTDGVLVQAELDKEVSGVDFHLDRLGALEVHATEADTGAFRPGQVEVYDSAGELVKWRIVDAPGSRIEGLEPGSYYVRYGSSWNPVDTHQDELWPDIPCEPSCDVTQGTPVPVALNGPPVVLDMPLTACPGWTVADVSHNVGWYPVLFACQELSVRRSRLEAGESLTLQSGRLVVMGDGFMVEDGASLVVEIVPEWAEESP